MKNILLSFVFVLLCAFGVLGNNDSIRINVLFNNDKVELDEKYFSDKIGDSISFSNIKFYISNVQFYKNNQLVVKSKREVFLIDLANKESLTLGVFEGRDFSYDAIKFDLGIDSVTNCSGVYGGDLDPTTGMYWTWQSGYINFKLEGSSYDLNGKSEDFVFHIGGYSYPNSSLRSIELMTNGKDLYVDFEIDLLLESIKLKETNHVMSPGKETMRVADLFESVISISK